MVSIRSKPILPAVLTDATALDKQLKGIQRRVADQIRRDFQRTVATWTKKPKFTVSLKRKANTFILFAGTNNEIYGYVTKGTRPHIIRARNAPKLIFRWPSIPKTQPGILGSSAGGFATNSQIASKDEVHHPGTKARKFDEIIARRFRDKMVKEANAALLKYLQQTTRPAFPPAGRR